VDLNGKCKVERHTAFVEKRAMYSSYLIGCWLVICDKYRLALILLMVTAGRQIWRRSLKLGETVSDPDLSSLNPTCIGRVSETDSRTHLTPWAQNTSYWVY